MKTHNAGKKIWSDFGIEVPATATGEFATTCPKCSDSRKKKKAKCFSGNIEKQVGNCHHCGFTINLKQHSTNRIHKPKKRTKNPQLYNTEKLPESVLEWFKKRGICEQVLKRNKIGYGKIFMSQEEKEVDAIQFPYFKDGEVVNIKYRDGKKNFRQVKDAEKILYKFDDISNESTIIITEGEIDALSFEEAGYIDCVSVPDGAPPPKSNNYSSKFDYLEPAFEIFNNAQKVILATDNDGPGIQLSDELARRIGREKCWNVSYPEGCKDANEILVKYGKNELKKVVENAIQIPIVGVHEITEIQEKLNHLYKHGFKKGLKTGWAKIDEYYTVRPGEMTIVTGIPGHGKSEFMDNLMMNLANKEDCRFGIFSPENLPLERHAAKLAEKYAHLPFNLGPTKRMTEEELSEIIKFLNKHIYFIMPEENDINIERILDCCKALIFRKGINGLVIDPWNEIEHKRDSYLTETEYVSQALSKIRRFARVNDIHIWIVAHPTKLQKLGNGKYPVPTPYDIAGSAHWRNKADNCLCVFRDFETDNVQLHVQKIRFKEVGRVGVIDIYYNKATGTYRTNELLPWKEVNAR